MLCYIISSSPLPAAASSKTDRQHLADGEDELHAAGHLLRGNWNTGFLDYIIP